MADQKRMKQITSLAAARARIFLDGMHNLSTEQALTLKIREAARAKRAMIRARTRYNVIAESIESDMEEYDIEEFVASSYAYAQRKKPSKAMPKNEEGGDIFRHMAERFGLQKACDLVDWREELSTVYEIKEEAFDRLSADDQAWILATIGNKPALVVDFPTAASQSEKTPTERRAQRKKSSAT